MVRYQAFGLPEKRGRHRYNHPQDEDTDSIHSFSSNNSHSHNNSTTKVISAFDAAKKAAQQKSLQTSPALVIEISASFPLPVPLANVEKKLESDDDDTYGTERVIWVRRIPILAKFSPKANSGGSGTDNGSGSGTIGGNSGGGVRFLALQYTPTMVRIATVEGDGVAAVASGTLRNLEASKGTPHYHSDNKHWTVDLSFDSNPIPTDPDKLPTFREGTSLNLFGKAAHRDMEGVIPGTTVIIGGGVLWCQRMNQTLDLILVTTTSVLVYNMNVSRRQLIKTHVFPHAPAASFWFEPQTRTLVVGSYKSNVPQDGMAFSEGTKMTGDDSDLLSAFPPAVMEMKTLFFSRDSTVETLPIFAVGMLREMTVERGHSGRGSLSLRSRNNSITSIDSNEDRNVVLPTDLFIVNLYGSVYCVELGSLGYGQGIGLTELDREAGCIRVRQHVSPFLQFWSYVLYLLVFSYDLSVALNIIYLSRKSIRYWESISR